MFRACYIIKSLLLERILSTVVHGNNQDHQDTLPVIPGQDLQAYRVFLKISKNITELILI